MNWSGAERELDDRAAAIPKPLPSPLPFVRNSTPARQAPPRSNGRRCSGRTLSWVLLAAGIVVLIARPHHEQIDCSR